MISNNLLNTTNGFNVRLVVNRNNKEFHWNIQEFQVPTINLTQASMTSSPKRAIYMIPGSGVIYDNMHVNYLIDEKFLAYEYLYEWLMECCNPKGNNYTTLSETYASGVVTITHNNWQDQGVMFEFSKMYPMVLGDISYSYVSDSPTPLVGTVTFGYDVYKFKRVAT